jgi:hypothetical protein
MNAGSFLRKNLNAKGGGQMITQIGITAGDIWHYLDEHGKSRLDDIVCGIGRERDIVLMSTGWLAREGHVIVEGAGPNYDVSLRNNIFIPPPNTGGLKA